MSFKETYEKEKYVVLHGQTVRFRLVKYSIIIPVFVGIYFWKGFEFTFYTLFISLIVSIAAHFFFRYKTKAWTKAWGLYRPLLFGIKLEESVSLKMCKEYLGKEVKIIIDQPFGSSYEGVKYELNYGFVPNTVAPDGKGLDAYYLSSQEPLKEATGHCIAIIHRLEDDDDKLILAVQGSKFTNQEIERAVNFREKLFRHTIVRI